MAEIVQPGGGGGGTPASPDTSIQFNDGGSFGGDADLTWDKTNKIETITGDITFTDTGTGGNRTISVADSAVLDTYASQLILKAGKGNGTGGGGEIDIIGGDGGDDSTQAGQGGGFFLQSGVGGVGISDGNGGNGGSFLLKASNGGSTNGAGITGNGGDVILQAGDSPLGFSTGVPGKFIFRPKGDSDANGILDFDSLSTSDKTFTFPNQSGIIATVTSGSGAPGTTPAALGQIYIDTNAAKVYISTGTSSSADWTIVN